MSHTEGDSTSNQASISLLLNHLARIKLEHEEKYFEFKKEKEHFLQEKESLENEIAYGKEEIYTLKQELETLQSVTSKAGRYKALDDWKQLVASLKEKTLNLEKENMKNVEKIKDIEDQLIEKSKENEDLFIRLQAYSKLLLESGTRTEQQHLPPTSKKDERESNEEEGLKFVDGSNNSNLPSTKKKQANNISNTNEEYESSENSLSNKAATKKEIRLTVELEKCKRYILSLQEENKILLQETAILKRFTVTEGYDLSKILQKGKKMLDREEIKQQQEDETRKQTEEDGIFDDNVISDDVGEGGDLDRPESIENLNMYDVMNIGGFSSSILRSKIQSKSDRIREENRQQKTKSRNSDTNIDNGQEYEIGNDVNVEAKNEDMSDKLWESKEDVKITNKRGVVSTVLSLLYSPVSYVLSTNKESIDVSKEIQEDKNDYINLGENVISTNDQKKQELVQDDHPLQSSAMNMHVTHASSSTRRMSGLSSDIPNKQQLKSHFGNNESYPILQV